jgi:hypothetical protein
VCLIFALNLSFLSCGTLNNNLNENQKMVINELEKITKEDLFSPGANNWEGYTGCKNKIEKIAYTKNIVSCIDDLKMQVRDTIHLTKLKDIIIQHEGNAEVLEEEFRADTDESEIRWMYFNRIRKIVGV